MISTGRNWRHDVRMAMLEILRAFQRIAPDDEALKNLSQEDINALLRLNRVARYLRDQLDPEALRVRVEAGYTILLLEETYHGRRLQTVSVVTHATLDGVTDKPTGAALLRRVVGVVGVARERMRRARAEVDGAERRASSC